MNKFLSIVLLSLLFASCQNSGVRQKTEPVPSAPATVVTPAPPVPGASQPAAVPATPATNSAPTAALNPAHGAPGHRCDIPVGAPLNSPPGNAPATSTSPAPALVQMQAPTLPQQPVNGNARLNPAHGQPGHDCSVPVGQPLKG
jgi:hypothetical protein